MADLLGPTKRGVRWDESQFQAPLSTVVAYKEVNGAWVRSDAKAGVTLHSLCGVNALAMAESAVGQTYVNTMALFAKMAPVKRCDSDGASTIYELRDQALADGFKVAIVNYNDAGIAEATWRDFLGHQTAAGAVVIVETLEGHALRDFISGQTEDAQLTGVNRLQRHFFGVYAANTATSLALFPGHNNLPHGYVVADGCNGLMNPVVSGVRTRVIGADKHQMLYYDYALVRASRPAALLAVYPKAVAPTPTPAPQPVVTVAALQSQITLLQTQVTQLEAVIANVRNAVK